MSPTGKTRWTCQLCQRTGVVEYQAGAGVWQVTRQILDLHIAASPTCKGGLGDIRCALVPSEPAGAEVPR